MKPSLAAGYFLMTAEPLVQGTRLQLRGHLDASAELAVAAHAFPIEIDLGALTLVNSQGVLKWITFITELSGRGPVSLLRCAEVMVHHFNIMHACLGTARVRSVLAPYRCTSCDEPDLSEVELPEHDAWRAAELAAPRPCRRCPGACTFDDRPQDYFRFAGRALSSPDRAGVPDGADSSR